MGVSKKHENIPRRQKMLKLKIGLFVCVATMLGAVAINSGKAEAAGVNLIQNGGFETGNLMDWSTSNDSYVGNDLNNYDVGVSAQATNDYNSITYSPYQGTYFAFLGSEYSLGYLYQNITTTPGDTYQLTYYLASDGLTPNEFQTIVGGTTLSDLTNIGAQTYTLYTFNFTATSATTEIEFGERNDNGYLSLDNVSVEAVPEPLSIGGTLVAGAMGWWIKRKRVASSKVN